MNLDEAQKQLAALLEPLIQDSEESSRRNILSMSETSEDYQPLAESMAKGLLGQALSNGISNIETDIQLSPLSGGAASDFVFRAHSNVSLIIKIQMDPKLKNEAAFLRSIHPSIHAWGRLFPRVLAMQVDKSPYAYAMEDFREQDGYKDLSKWIFNDKLLPEARIAQSNSLLDAVLKRLTPIYSGSRNTNSSPTLDGDAYLGRIRTRMLEAEALFDGFKVASVQADNESLNGWRWQLEEIEKRRDKALAFLPGFETAVHGDSHPGNILIRLEANGAGDYRPDIRLIDPRGWYFGDYVFDLAKLAHYLILVGPVERWQAGSDCEYRATGQILSVGPIPIIPDWLKKLEEKVAAATNALGNSMNDPGVAARYELAMASCFLGSVRVRWENEQEQMAILMYVEGLKWLNKFRLRLSEEN